MSRGLFTGLTFLLNSNALFFTFFGLPASLIQKPITCYNSHMSSQWIVCIPHILLILDDLYIWLKSRSFTAVSRLGIDTNKMALGGDSAGANLALSVALALRDSNNNTTKQHHNLFRVLYLLYGQFYIDENVW